MAKTTSVILLSLLLIGCEQENEFAPPPPTSVTAQPPTIEDKLIFEEHPAETRTSSRVEIRARVDGFLKSVDFESGTYVEQGQLLFTIEPEQYEAAVATAKGQLAQAQAELEVRATETTRLENALKKNAVSEIDVLKSQAAVKVAKANITVAEASLEDAQRNLSYTKIAAPTAGRISRPDVDPGSLVKSGEATLLATIVQDDPIYVYFEVNERKILPFLEKRPTSGQKAVKPSEELKLTLSDGSVYSKSGIFNYFDNTANPETGTIQVRAEFDNPDGKLAGGLFVRIGIPKQLNDAVLVPQSLVQRDLSGSFVLTLGEGDIVERRVVVATEFTDGAMRILEPYSEESGTGLQSEDRLITSNLQRARPGSTVVLKTKPAAPKDAKQEEKEMAN